VTKKPKSEALRPVATDTEEPEGGEDDSERESGSPVQGKKKGTRRKRGKRKKSTLKEAFVETEGEGETGEEGPAVIAGAQLTPSIIVPSTPVPPVATSLVVSDNVLGASLSYVLSVGTYRL